MTLKAQSLRKRYAQKTVIEDVSLSVDRGEIVGLLGPNGAGKTTCFYTIVGLIRADAGRVWLDDQELTHAAMHERAAQGLGYLPQEASVFRTLTAEANIMAMLELNPALDALARQSRLESLLQEFGLEHVRTSLGQSLSGGERRRLEITRALATNPAIILLDEPFAGVDPLAVNDVQDIVKTLKERGLGVLITDHSVRDTLAVVDRAYLLCEGQVLREGDSEFLVNDEVSRELYLGPRFSM